MTIFKNLSGAAGAPVAHGPWNGFIDALPGLFLVGTLACFSIVLARNPWLAAHGIGSLTLAILIGIAFGNTVYAHLAGGSEAGVSFCKQTLLRAGIVLYGLRLTFQDIAHVGVAGIAIDLLIVASTFVIADWLGARLRMDRTVVMLIGAGSSICGAAAVMATDPVVKGRSEQVAVAVSTVLVFGTIAMFAYPALYALYVQHHALSPAAYGVYVGSTIHEVAQVVVAGKAVGQSAADTAVITKMVRVMLLAPFLMILSAYLGRVNRRDASSRPLAKLEPARIQVPGFALGFVGIAAINSTALLPVHVVSTAIDLDSVLLTMAMAALGVTTQASAIRTAGIKPMVLAGLLFGWLVVGGFAINLAVQRMF
jgi:uncharacterized integral membrane protein (TIGR00698 family)